MSTKPTTLPEWATTGGTTVEPSAGQKAAGFAVGTRPPARWVNWLLNTLYLWAEYVRDGVFQSAGSAAAIEAQANTGPALKVTPGATTISAERIGTQSAPSGAGLVGDRYTDADGIVRTCRAAATPGTFKAVGALQTRQVLTSASGTYTTPAGVVAINVRAYGGGGGGGNAPAGGGGVAVGGGGGAGGRAEKLILAPSASYAYACGAAGGYSGAGGDTTFGSSLVTAKGGGAGEDGVDDTEFHLVSGSTQPHSGGLGDSVGYGEAGDPSISVHGQYVAAGRGGSSEVGVGGRGYVNSGAETDGEPGYGYASGGGGAIGSDSTPHVGGPGTAGLIVVDEYY